MYIYICINLRVQIFSPLEKHPFWRPYFWIGWLNHQLGYIGSTLYSVTMENEGLVRDPHTHKRNIILVTSCNAGWLGGGWSNRYTSNPQKVQVDRPNLETVGSGTQPRHVWSMVDFQGSNALPPCGSKATHCKACLAHHGLWPKLLPMAAGWCLHDTWFVFFGSWKASGGSLEML